MKPASSNKLKRRVKKKKKKKKKSPGLGGSGRARGSTRPGAERFEESDAALGVGQAPDVEQVLELVDRVRAAGGLVGDVQVEVVGATRAAQGVAAVGLRETAYVSGGGPAEQEQGEGGPTAGRQCRWRAPRA